LRSHIPPSWIAIVTLALIGLPLSDAGLNFQSRTASMALRSMPKPTGTTVEISLISPVSEIVADRITCPVAFAFAAKSAFDEKSAEQAARIRRHLEKAGKKVGPLDILIAGTARANGAVLVTNNVKEFSRVPGLEVEDWF